MTVPVLDSLPAAGIVRTVPMGKRRVGLALAEVEVPHVPVDDGAHRDGLGRVDDAAAADGEHEAKALSLAEADPSRTRLSRGFGLTPPSSTYSTPALLSEEVTRPYRPEALMLPPPKCSRTFLE